MTVSHAKAKNPKQKKSEYLPLRVTPDMVSDLEMVAGFYGISISKVAREGIQQHIDKIKNEARKC